MNNKLKKISDYPDSWTIAKGLMENKPIFVRYKDSLVEAVGHPNYPFQIGVAVPLINPTEDGLAIDSEASELDSIEDALEKSFGENQQAIHVITITFNGMREFVFYAAEWKPEHFEQKAKQVEAGVRDGHKLQFMMQEDREWETFKRFAWKRKN